MALPAIPFLLIYGLLCVYWLAASGVACLYDISSEVFYILWAIGGVLTFSLVIGLSLQVVRRQVRLSDAFALRMCALQIVFLLIFPQVVVIAQLGGNHAEAVNNMRAGDLTPMLPIDGAPVPSGGPAADGDRRR